MSTRPMLHFERRSRFSGSLAILSLLVLSLPATVLAQRVKLAVRAADSTALDAGPVPASQPLQLTVRLALAVDRSAVLDQLLTNQTTPQSPAYHRWLTPQEFAVQFGASDDQIAATMAWLQSQGLSVDAVSVAKTRMTVSGTAAQVQNAFAVTVRRYQVANALYVANSNQPSLPPEAAALIAGVSGLNDLPTAAPAAVASVSGVTSRTRPANSGQNSDPYLIAASAVDANTAPILTMNAEDCSSDFAQSDYDAYHDLFRQANAQGITVLATSGCGTRGTGSFPASLAEVTAVAVSPAIAPFNPIALRPAWQSAPGLPADASRYEPDLTTTSISAFAQTISTIVQQTGTRQGNINAVLYSLAPTPGLYTQPDATASTAPGTWESATGLGVVDLSKLLKVYPRSVGTLASGISLTSNVTNSPGMFAGSDVVFTATVFASSAGAAAPSGTVTFFDNYNGAAVSLGSGYLTANGLSQSIATFSTISLAAGTHSVYAVYNGDTNFSTASSSPIALAFSDYNLTMVPQTLTINRGKSGQAVILIGAVAGFNGTVTFGCTPPANTETTCSFSPTSLSGGGSTTLTITTSAPITGQPGVAGSKICGEIWGVQPQERSWRCSSAVFRRVAAVWSPRFSFCSARRVSLRVWAVLLAPLRRRCLRLPPILVLRWERRCLPSPPRAATASARFATTTNTRSQSSNLMKRNALWRYP